MQWRIWLGILAVPLSAILFWYVAELVWLQPQLRTVFVHDGVLIRDNPGLVPDVWYLSYEVPGAAGLLAPLVFDAGSRCGIRDAFTVCNVSFAQGERVHIEGTQAGEAVHVERLIYLRDSPETGMAVKLYFYDPARDVDANGNILCSAKGLVSVERVIPQTETPLADTIRLLLRGEISDEEHAQGATSEFPLAGVTLKEAVVKNAVATLAFDDSQHKTSGGACRTGILWAQIAATAKQFDSVQSVRFEPGDLFQP